MPSNAGSSCTQRIVSEAKQPRQATHGLIGRSASERNSVCNPSPARTSNAAFTRISVFPSRRGLPEIPNTFIFSRSNRVLFRWRSLYRAGATTPRAMLSLFGAIHSRFDHHPPQTGCIHSPTIEQACAARKACGIVRSMSRRLTALAPPLSRRDRVIMLNEPHEREPFQCHEFSSLVV